MKYLFAIALLLLAVEVGAQTMQQSIPGVLGDTPMCQAREDGPWYSSRFDGKCYSVDDAGATDYLTGMKTPDGFPPVGYVRACRIDGTLCREMSLNDFMDDLQYSYVMNICEQRMGDAMRAMEPFIIEYDAEKKTAQAVVKNFPMLEPAWQQWIATKRDCWGGR